MTRWVAGCFPGWMRVRVFDANTGLAVQDVYAVDDAANTMEIWTVGDGVITHHVPRVVVRAALGYVVVNVREELTDASLFEPSTARAAKVRAAVALATRQKLTNEGG